MSRKHRAQCDERVEIKEEIYRVVSNSPEAVAHGADYAKPKEKGKEEELAYSSGCNYFHIQLTEANIGLSNI